MNQRLIAKTLLTAAAALVFWGCSTSATNAPSLNPTTGQHPATWQSSHWKDYLMNPDSCKPCHGSTTDKTQAGGTSKVSCFGCHHPDGPHHPADWAQASQHGRLGAQPKDNGLTGLLRTSFVACTRCHGDQYTNPVGITPACTACHTTAPHPAKPWVSGVSPSNPNHDRTDPSNAAECAKCHALGAHSSITPKPPAAAGTTPGCFNGTLCHTTNL
ncbi:hypothetical protein [Mesoterricola sediminis]|uniref:Cytochrome c7-like domain-containing protein n=1 Tax=Mesoterricola sediminis TaxID=2927980 RepID=A0AA48KEN4_9BACT|nr:hypothetical protein [Mesoterricola sediminis]BDU78245.1 hypothetical protein METESE_32030 [Mesoterricola sediminis]